MAEAVCSSWIYSRAVPFPYLHGRGSSTIWPLSVTNGWVTHLLLVQGTLLIIPECSQNYRSAKSYVLNCSSMPTEHGAPLYLHNSTVLLLARPDFVKMGAFKEVNQITDSQAVGTPIIRLGPELYAV